MANIELVIKINEDFIDKMNSIKDDRELSWAQLLTVYRGFHAMLQHGTPLPKGHGKIGDLDLAYGAIKAYQDLIRSTGKFDAEKASALILLGRCKELISEVDAIIEADKE